MNDRITTLAPSHPPADREAVDRAVADALACLDGRPPQVIVVNDTFRSTDTSAVFKALARQTDCSAANVIAAAGTHQAPPDEQEHLEVKLRRAMTFAEFSWHDCRSADLKDIGARGGWRGHPWLTGDGGVLAVGSVEPHYFAGFTGAHKTATIGCASFDDIAANHASAVSSDSRPCRLAGNPVYNGIECMLAALEAVRPVAAVNLVQVAETIVGACGGEALPSLQQAGLIAMKAFVRRIDDPADAIVAEVTGTLSRNFYQAEKGVHNSERAVRDGGLIVLASPCPEGIGQESSQAVRQFVEMLTEARTHAQAVAIVKDRGYTLGDHKAVRLRHLTDPAGRNVRLTVVSAGLDAGVFNELGIGWARTVDDALADAGVDPARQSVYHLYDAGNLCLMLDDPSPTAPSEV